MPIMSTYQLKNVVVDPVMVATSGAKLISDEAIETLKTQLIPKATVITPNIPAMITNTTMPTIVASTLLMKPFILMNVFYWFIIMQR